MNYQIKNIIKLSLPHICGDPIIKMTFALHESCIVIFLEKNRVYNLRQVDILNTADDKMSLQCTDESEVYIHSDFDLLQNIYYYPFISSVLSLNINVEPSQAAMLEVDISNEFKSLTYYSFVLNRKTQHKHYKTNETWSDHRGIFYYNLYDKNSFQFRVRATGVNLNDLYVIFQITNCKLFQPLICDQLVY